MKRLLILLALCAIPCWGQDLPVQVVTKPHPTIDKTFALVDGLAIFSAVADVENTHYALVHDRHVQEGNPIFFSRRPTRARMYEINAPIVGLELYYSYKWKREDDADRLVGRRLAKYRWYVIPIVNMAAHGVGVTVTLASTGR